MRKEGGKELGLEEGEGIEVAAGLVLQLLTGLRQDDQPVRRVSRDVCAVQADREPARLVRYPRLALGAHVRGEGFAG